MSKMNHPARISIFLSSPGDVQPEREAAERVIRRLGGIFATYVEFSVERWEKQFYQATMSFQEAISAMESFNLVIGILWKRVGSELPPSKFSRPSDETP